MKKMFKILMCALMVFVVGIGIAFKNTSSLGFDDNSKIIYSDNSGITIMNKRIEYKKIEKVIDKAKERMPQKHMTCNYLLYEQSAYTHYNV